MYVTRIPNRGSPPAILLRESYRDGGKVKTRTLANLSRLARRPRSRRCAGYCKDEAVVAPPDRLAIERPARCRTAMSPRRSALAEARPRPAAAAGGRSALRRWRCVALVVARVIEPASKLATARQLSEPRRRIRWAPCSVWGRSTRTSSTEPSICWAGRRRKHRGRRSPGAISQNGCLVLYDLTSSYLEGRCCELGRFGYSRDGKRGKLQIVFGLLCTAEGCPIAVEVFEGDVADPADARGPGRQAQAALQARAAWCWSATAA